MRKFQVNVNGTRYEVEVEEIDANAIPKAAEPVKAAPAGAGTEVRSPMPGNILQVNVNPGDVVKEGQQLMILEAMKMENEIVAPKDGVISQVVVKVGEKVDTGAALVILA